MEELGLDLPGATGLLDRCPAWLAGFRSSEKAAEIQTRLERKGVTVTRTRGPLPEVRTAAGPDPSSGFRAWLAADG